MISYTHVHVTAASNAHSVTKCYCGYAACQPIADTPYECPRCGESFEVFDHIRFHVVK